MSTHTATVPPHGSHSDAPHGHITVRTLLVIYGALLGLMVLTLGAAMIDLGRANFIIAMSIATVKMVLIVLYFMHVRYSEKLVWLAALGSFLFLVILVVGFLNDYWTRDILNIPGK